MGEELFTLQSVLHAAQQLQVEEPDMDFVPGDAKLGDGVDSEVIAEQNALLAARQLVGDAIFSLEVAIERCLLPPLPTHTCPMVLPSIVLHMDQHSLT